MTTHFYNVFAGGKKINKRPERLAAALDLAANYNISAFDLRTAIWVYHRQAHGGTHHGLGMSNAFAKIYKSVQYG